MRKLACILLFSFSFYLLPAHSEKIDFVKKALDLNQINDTKGAIAILDKGITEEPINAELYSLRGPLLANIGKYKEAMKDHNMVITLATDKKSKLILSNAYLNRGLIEIKWNKPRKAEADFKKSLEVDPRLFITHLEWGKLLLSQDRKAEAIKHFKKAQQQMVGAASDKSLENVDKLLKKARGEK